MSDEKPKPGRPLNQLSQTERDLLNDYVWKHRVMAEIMAHREILQRILLGTSEKPTPNDVASQLQNLVDQNFRNLCSATADESQPWASYIELAYEELKRKSAQ